MVIGLRRKIKMEMMMENLTSLLLEFFLQPSPFFQGEKGNKINSKEKKEGGEDELYSFFLK